MTLIGVTSLSRAAHSGASFTGTVESIVTSVSTLATELFHIIQGAYFFITGVFEVSFGLFRKDPIGLSVKKVKIIFEKFTGRLACLSKKIFTYPVLHGALFLGSGVCEILQGLHSIEVIALGSALPFIAFAGSGCFILGNILMLAHNIKVCIIASNVPEDASEEEIENARRAKVSAIFAIVSALNYIAGIALSMFGGPAAIVIVLVALGLVFGGLKILYDWFQPCDKQKLKNSAIN
ncbi:MAG: hypothetical protein VX777_06385 [Chlamydiota bacterium]|nr:hypothetical protein [Chlamydiota bacterium]